MYVILYEFLSFHVLNIVFHNLDKGKRMVFLHYDFSYEYEAYTMPIIVYYFDSYLFYGPIMGLPYHMGSIMVLENRKRLKSNVTLTVHVIIRDYP